MGKTSVQTLFLATCVLAVLLVLVLKYGHRYVGRRETDFVLKTDTTVYIPEQHQGLAVNEPPPSIAMRKPRPDVALNSVPFFIRDRFGRGRDLCRMWDDEAPDRPATVWWQYGCLMEKLMDGPVDYKCQDVRAAGYNRLCWDPPYTPSKQDCLVYSFGINNDFLFEDAMGGQGCTVYSFDPVQDKGDHKRGENVFVEKMGIGAANSESFMPHIDGDHVKHMTKWKMRTLKSLITRLQHEKRTIDVLKLDIEVYEWDVLANIIKDGILPQVRQLVVDYHIFSVVPPRELYKENYDTFMSLRTMGFQFFFAEGRDRFHHFNYFTTKGEFSYVNTKFKAP